MEVILNARHAAGDELDQGGADHVGQREDAEHEEVHGEQQVDVVLTEYLKWAFQITCAQVYSTCIMHVYSR